MKKIKPKNLYTNIFGKAIKVESFKVTKQNKLIIEMKEVKK